MQLPKDTAFQGEAACLDRCPEARYLLELLCRGCNLCVLRLRRPSLCRCPRRTESLAIRPAPCLPRNQLRISGSEMSSYQDLRGVRAPSVNSGYSIRPQPEITYSSIVKKTKMAMAVKRQHTMRSKRFLAYGAGDYRRSDFMQALGCCSNPKTCDIDGPASITICDGLHTEPEPLPLFLSTYH